MSRKDYSEKDTDEIYDQPHERVAGWVPSKDTIAAIQGGNDTYSLREAQEAKVIEELRKVEGINPTDWKDMNEYERLEVLQDVEERVARVQGRPPAQVATYTATPGEFGYYNPDTNKINISSNSLKNDDVKEVVDTLIHEGRHAYQHYAVEHPDTYSNRQEVEAWAHNLQKDHYLSADKYGQELYQAQPVEKDAWRYARTIINDIYGD